MPAHALSQLINEELGQNFFDYINSFRIQEFERRLVDPRNAHVSILGIAMDVGFNSKSSFNTAFRKFKGMTPSEYRKNLSP